LVGVISSYVMRGGPDLPYLPQNLLTDSAGWKELRFLAQPFRFIGKAFFEGLNLLETESLPLHGAAPCLSEAGARTAISSQIRAAYRAVMK